MSNQTISDPENPWMIAIRPKTLPAAASPVFVGLALAYSDHGMKLWPALACLLTALLLQIGSNLANDVYDYEKGVDGLQRLGPTRVTQAGLLSPKQVKRFMWIVLGVTGIIGFTLVLQGGWVIFWLGIAAILSAIAYTGGPLPLGYHGLGDIFVFIFFGLVATIGTYYLQTGSVQSYVWWMASAVGFLTVNILVVNNLRDVDHDAQAGKKTLAVRLGAKGSRIQYIFLMSISYLIPVYLVVAEYFPLWVLLTWVSLPYGIYLAKYVTLNSGKALNRTLAGTGQLELMYSILFAIGILSSEL